MGYRLLNPFGLELCSLDSDHFLSGSWLCFWVSETLALALLTPAFAGLQTSRLHSLSDTCPLLGCWTFLSSLSLPHLHFEPLDPFGSVFSWPFLGQKSLTLPHTPLSGCEFLVFHTLRTFWLAPGFLAPALRFGFFYSVSIVFLSVSLYHSVCLCPSPSLSVCLSMTVCLSISLTPDHPPGPLHVDWPPSP